MPDITLEQIDSLEKSGYIDSATAGQMRARFGQGLTEMPTVIDANTGDIIDVGNVDPEVMQRQEARQSWVPQRRTTPGGDDTRPSNEDALEPLGYTKTSGTTQGIQDIYPGEPPSFYKDRSFGPEGGERGEDEVPLMPQKPDPSALPQEQGGAFGSMGFSLPDISTRRSDAALKEIHEAAEGQKRSLMEIADVEAEKAKKLADKEWELSGQAATEALRQHAYADARDKIFKEWKARDEEYQKQLEAVKPVSFWSQSDEGASPEAEAGTTLANIGKVLTIIAGGLTSHLTGGRNLAMQMLNKFVTDDLNKQRLQLAKIRSGREMANNRYAQALMTFKDKDAAYVSAYKASWLAVERQMQAISSATRSQTMRQNAQLMADKIREHVGAIDLQQANIFEQRADKHAMMNMKLMLPMLQEQARMQQLRDLATNGDFDTQVGARIKLLVPEKLYEKAFKEFGMLKAAQKAAKEANRIFSNARRMGLEKYVPRTADGERFRAGCASLISQLYKISGKQVSEGEIEKVIEPFMPKKAESDGANRAKEEEFIRMLMSQITTPVLSGNGVIKR